LIWNSSHVHDRRGNDVCLGSPDSSSLQAVRDFPITPAEQEVVHVIYFNIPCKHNDSINMQTVSTATIQDLLRTIKTKYYNKDNLNNFFLNP
jgi:hypothetical protein